MKILYKLRSTMPDNSYRAGALIFDRALKKCILVFQRQSNLWGIPKGRRFTIGESYKACMYREVEEECGLNLKQHRFEIMDAVQVHSKCRIFLIRLLSYPIPHCFPPLEDGKANHEIVKVDWVPWQQISLRTMNSVTKKTIQYTDNHLSHLKQKHLKISRHSWSKSYNSPHRSWKRYEKLMKEY